MKIYPINTTLYAVHRHHAFQKKAGGRVIVCKVRGYLNQDGKISPTCSCTGLKQEISLFTHRLFEKLEKAVESIKSHKK